MYGKLIRKAREEKGLTIVQLAFKTKLTQNCLWSMEREKNLPNLKTMEKLTAVLDNLNMGEFKKAAAHTLVGQAFKRYGIDFSYKLVLECTKN